MRFLGTVWLVVLLGFLALIAFLLWRKRERA